VDALEGVAGLGPREQRQTLAEHHGDQRDRQLVDELGVERLPDQVASVEVHVALAGRLASGLHERVDGPRHRAHGGASGGQRSRGGHQHRSLAVGPRALEAGDHVVGASAHHRLSQG
jgi:hypothetical protein